jgi:hypothetical protein
LDRSLILMMRNIKLDDVVGGVIIFAVLLIVLKIT